MGCNSLQQHRVQAWAHLQCGCSGILKYLLQASSCLLLRFSPTWYIPRTAEHPYLSICVLTQSFSCTFLSLPIRRLVSASLIPSESQHSVPPHCATLPRVSSHNTKCLTFTPTTPAHVVEAGKQHSDTNGLAECCTTEKGKQSSGFRALQSSKKGEAERKIAGGKDMEQRKRKPKPQVS